MIPLRDYNPSSSRPVITILLILACTAVFLYMSYGLGSEAARERFVRTYGATPAALTAPGVLGAYLMLFPRARIRSLAFFGVFFTTVAIPAIVFLPLWFLLQFLYGLGSIGSSGGGVAWWAHVGGFMAGIVLVPVFARRRPRSGV